MNTIQRVGALALLSLQNKYDLALLLRARLDQENARRLMEDEKEYELVTGGKVKYKDIPKLDDGSIDIEWANEHIECSDPLCTVHGDAEPSTVEMVVEGADPAGGYL